MLSPKREFTGPGYFTLNLARTDFSDRNGFPDKEILIPVSYNKSKPGEDKPHIKIPAPDFVAIDLDGVVANKIDFNEHVAQVFLLRRGIPVWTKTLRELRDQGEDLWTFAKEQAWKAGDLGDDRTLSEELRVIERYHLEEERNHVIVDYDSLRWLRTHVPLIAWTNRRQVDAESFISNSGLADCFDGVFGQIEDGRTKPYPDGLIRAQKELGLGKCGIMVGDSVTDLGILAYNALFHGFNINPVGILAPSHGFNQLLEDRLFAAGAVSVMPSLMHLVKDVANLIHEDYYWLVKWSLKELDRHRFPAKPSETNDFVRYALLNNLTPPEEFTTDDYSAEQFYAFSSVHEIPLPEWAYPKVISI